MLPPAFATASNPSNCVSYDPTFSGELAVILQDGRAHVRRPGRRVLLHHPDERELPSPRAARPWSVSVREKAVGFIEATIFITLLLVGLLYLWRIGALDWAPKKRG